MRKINQNIAVKLKKYVKNKKNIKILLIFYA